LGKIVVFSNNVESDLKELVDILYEKNYFGFKNDAKLYVEEFFYL